MFENERKLQSILDKNILLVYGIGERSNELIHYFENKMREIILFDSDEKKWNKTWENRRINRPDRLEKYYKNGAAVIIGAINYQYEIAKMLIEKFSVLECDLYSYTNEHYENAVYNVEKIKNNLKNIEKVFSYLSDPESKEYYVNSLKMRIERNPLNLIANPKSNKIGEYSNCIQLKEGDIIIDCGAYTGDTVQKYLKSLKKCEIHAIEPFSESFQKLNDNKIKGNWDNVYIYNCAVSDKIKDSFIAYNESDKFTGMKISSADTKQKQYAKAVQVNTMDNLLRNIENVNYIKMDIEGEEKNALMGAKNIINKFRPKLMISGYHKIEDFWEIPMIIAEMEKDYKIYVGHAPGVSTELEYYCTIN